MAVTFRIPKLSDREIARALVRIRDALRAANPRRQLRVVLHIPHQGGVNLRDENPLDTPELKFIFDAHSQVIGTFQLVDESTGNEAFVIRREHDKITDSASLSDNWFQNIREAKQQAQFPHLHVSLLTAARTELKANDVEAAFKGNDDTSWNRYRDSQTAVINSLQQATETLILRASERNAELDKARAERFEKLEADLRNQVDRERKELQSAHEKKVEDPRIDQLRKAKPAVAFLSVEPLLEDLGAFNLKSIHWVIVGGESGHGARPIDNTWVQSIRAQCRAQKVPFFFKQWVGFRKAEAGRELDRRTYDEIPEIVENPVPSAEDRTQLQGQMAAQNHDRLRALAG